MKLDEAIQKFLSSLELSDNQSSLAATRNNNLRDRLIEEAPFLIEKTLLIGSYARDTQIKPRPTDHWSLDVDAVAILNGIEKDIENYFKNEDGGWRLLEHTYQALKGFQGLPVEKDAPAVTVKWETQKMKIEVVPAFKRTGGGLLIPNGGVFSTNWRVTNPIGDAEALSKANLNSGGKLKPLIKSLKCWNRQEGKILSSFAIETVAYKTGSVSFSDFHFELQYFFKQLLELDGKQVAPPSGLGDAVKIDLSWKRDRVERAYDLANRAQSLAAQGLHRDAIETMGKIFGTPFPLTQSPSPWTFFG